MEHEECTYNLSGESNQVREDMMGRACSAHGNEDNVIQASGGKARMKDGTSKASI
jgi:hypothetical protein